MKPERLKPAFSVDEERLNQLKAIVPEAFADGKIHWEVLHEALGDYLEPEEQSAEHFGLFWPGKRDARRLASIPSTGTLVPTRGEGVNEDSTHNVFIEGDNLEVLKLLQKSYAGRVKMIYIDPPYNTGSDFVYPDDFKDAIDTYLKLTGQATSEGTVLSTNPETSGRFHSDWLSMMYPRLRLAKQLLRPDGVIFLSIDDNEVSNLRKICDEVFGDENFAAQFPWRKRTAKSDVPFGISQDYEWILCYANSSLFDSGVEGAGRKYYETPDLPERPWRIHDLTKQTSSSERPNSHFTIVNPKTGQKYPPNLNRTWAITSDTFKKYYDEKRIVFPGDYEFLRISQPVFRYFKSDDEKKAGDKFGYVAVSTNLPKEVGMTQDGTKDITELFDTKVFAFPKPVSLLKYLLKVATSYDKDVIILDFFAGSATTAHAVMELNAEDDGRRQFVTVQLPEPCDEDSEAFKAGYNNIAEIGKERIRRAIKKLFNAKSKGDLGFKSFKLAHSNLKPWEDYQGGDVKQIEMLFDRAESPLVDDWTPESLLSEVMLIQGFLLDSTVKALPECKQNHVQLVTSPAVSHRLMVCLDSKMAASTITQLKFESGDIFICLDSAITDEAKLRLSDKSLLRTI